MHCDQRGGCCFPECHDVRRGEYDECPSETRECDNCVNYNSLNGKCIKCEDHDLYEQRKCVTCKNGGVDIMKCDLCIDGALYEPECDPCGNGESYDED